MQTRSADRAAGDDRGGEGGGRGADTDAVALHAAHGRRTVGAARSRGGVVAAGWPAFDEAVARAEEIVVPVQVNGKVAARLTVPRTSPRSTCASSRWPIRRWRSISRARPSRKSSWSTASSSASWPIDAPTLASARGSCVAGCSAARRRRLRLFARRPRVVPAGVHPQHRRAALRQQTSVFDIERRVTERVRGELIGRGKYKVFPVEAGTDAVLTGEITAISRSRQLSTAAAGFALRADADRAKVEFKDLKTGKVLWSNPALQFREEFEPTTAPHVDANAFFGQDTNALERLATEFARSVVSAMLEAF